MAKKTPAKKETVKKAAAKPAAEKKAAKPKKEAAPKAAKKAAPVQEEAAPAVLEAVAEKPKKAPKEPKAPKVPKATKAQVAAEKAASEDAKRWMDLKEKFGSEKASAYSMSGNFEANKPLQHKVLGWGFIQSVQNDRLEVLFESGPKMLISNYKAK